MNCQDNFLDCQKYMKFVLESLDPRGKQRFQ